jgi:hypothetical protein
MNGETTKNKYFKTLGIYNIKSINATTTELQLKRNKRDKKVNWNNY